MTTNSSSSTTSIPQADLESFHQHLASSTRILALLGAGLSASSGLPTFRGAGGLWRTHDATSLATPEAFSRDPGLVWQFYNYRRHKALQAAPNRAHYALAELARQNPRFMTLSQNVDGLSQRAGHPEQSLQLLHGNLFELKCTNFYCRHVETNYTDPVAPALAIAHTSGTGEEQDPTATLDISNPSTPLPSVPISDLPKCPICKTGLLRPGVVWFGEGLPSKVLHTVDSFIHSSEPVDLILVIGTSAKVYPAAGYVDEARSKGARVAVVNMDRDDAPASGVREGDWFFCGDAAEIVPKLLEGVIGEVKGAENGRL